MIQDSVRQGATGSPGIAFIIASCMAYISRKGVMMPGVSAGSNQVGASETCTPMRSSPSGAALAVRRVAPIMAAAERPRTPRRVVLGDGETMAVPLLCAVFQANVFVGRGIRVSADQAQGRFADPP